MLFPLLLVMTGLSALLSLRFAQVDQGIVRAENLRILKEPDPYPVVDAHLHVEPHEELFEFAVKVMDAAGIAAAVNLGGTCRQTLEESLALAAKYPGRFVTFADGLVDRDEQASPDFGRKIARTIQAAHDKGAAGIGEIVKWGLHGLAWDDERLEPMWCLLEKLQMPVNWHVADPSRYWRPETAAVMLEYPPYGSDRPLKHELIMQQERVLERHPDLVVIAAHCNWLNDQVPHLEYRLRKYANYYVDLSACFDEWGRNADELAGLCVEFSNRILFGTDPVFRPGVIETYGGPEKAAADFAAFYKAHFLFLGTDQTMIPCAFKGNPGKHLVGYENGFVRYANDGIALPPDVLRMIYYENAERLFGISVAR